MRKRAMVIGLLLVPLATGGAVLLAKSGQQSAPKSKATITLPSSDDAPSEFSPSEGSGFVLAPSEATDEPRDLKQQRTEEQPETEAPQESNSSEEVGSDHATRQVLLASESTSANTADSADGSAPVISSARGLFNSYAFANSRRSTATSGGGSSGAGAVSSAPAADTKSPHDTSITENGVSDTTTETETNTTQPQEVARTDGDGSSGQPPPDDSNSLDPDHAPNQPGADIPEHSDPTFEEQPPTPNNPVPYFPPVDERPHVTVPEPSTLMLLGLGLIACATASRRRRVKSK